MLNTIVEVERVEDVLNPVPPDPQTFVEESVPLDEIDSLEDVVGYLRGKLRKAQGDIQQAGLTARTRATIMPIYQGEVMAYLDGLKAVQRLIDARRGRK